MNLEFPTHFPVPSYPTRPTEEDEAATCAFPEALRDFLHLLVAQHTTSGSPVDAAGVHIDGSNQESNERSPSALVTQEAISAVIKNIAHPTKGEYVWDAAQHRWVLKLRPV